MNRYRKTYLLSLASLAAIMMCAIAAFAQSGGGFEITEAVIAGSGGTSTNGNTQIDSTAGQAIAAGAIGSGTFGLTSGFWNYTQLVPTAAHVSIGGRVVDPYGTGVANAVLHLHTQGGELRVSRSSPFGYFQFEGIAAGQAVLITVRARRYTYEPRTVVINEDIVDLNFTPEPEQP